MSLLALELLKSQRISDWLKWWLVYDVYCPPSARWRHCYLQRQFKESFSGWSATSDETEKLSERWRNLIGLEPIAFLQHAHRRSRGPWSSSHPWNRGRLCSALCCVRHIFHLKTVLRLHTDRDLKVTVVVYRRQDVLCPGPMFYGIPEKARWIIFFFLLALTTVSTY